MSTKITPKLPTKPTNGDEVCDIYGNKWYYDGESDTWLSKGAVYAPNYVTENNDGIISSDIYQKLEKLKRYIDTGIDLRPLKIYPGTDAYWYYFRSSDKCVRFIPEGQSTLRIEIDRARLFQILMKEICPGPRGQRGETGDTGPDGTPGADEVCYQPVINGNRLDFAIFTPTPLTRGGNVYLPNDHVPDISVRVYTIESTAAQSYEQLEYITPWLYNNSDDVSVRKFQYAREEFAKRSLGQAVSSSLCNISLSKVLVYSGTLAIDPIVTVDINPEDPQSITITSDNDIVDQETTVRSVSYDPATGIVCGSIYLKSNWSDFGGSFCVKSRQRGPDGVRGDPGDCVVRVVECKIDPTNITANQPIINTRLDCEQDILYTLTADLLEEVCVDKVSLLPNSAALANQSVLDSTFAAAQVILDECKYVNTYKVRLKDDEIPDLDLVHWDPQPGCFTKRYYDRHKYDWIPETDIPACSTIATWFGPDSTRPGLYPHKIITAPEPEEDECCEENFFWCENVQATSPASSATSASAAAQATSYSMNMRGNEVNKMSLGARKWNIKM